MCDRLEDDSEKFLAHLCKTSQASGGTLFEISYEMKKFVVKQKRSTKECLVCWSGEVAVQWLLTAGVVKTHSQAIQLCKILVKAGCLKPMQGLQAPKSKGGQEASSDSFHADGFHEYEIVAELYPATALTQRSRVAKIYSRAETIGFSTLSKEWCWDTLSSIRPCLSQSKTHSPSVSSTKRRCASADDKEVLQDQTADPNDVGINSVEWQRKIAGPFKRLDPNPDWWELAKLGVGLVSLVPVRIILLLVIIVLYWAVAKGFILLGQIGQWLKSFIAGQRDTKYTGPRGFLLVLTKIAARAVLFVMGFYHIQVCGEQHRSQDTRTIMVVNHLSYVEILYFMAREAPSFVFKRTCFGLPLIGDIAHTILQSIPVDNTGLKGGKGTQAISERVMQMQDPKWQGRKLLIFPEGTTSNGSCLLRFRTGVFVPGAPVQPVVIRLPFSRFSTCYESIYTTTHILRMLSQPINRMQIRYLPVYNPSLEEKANPSLYASNVRHHMASALRIPTINAGYRDKIRFHSWLRLQFDRHPLGLLAKLTLTDPTEKLPQNDPFRVIPDIPYFPLPNLQISKLSVNDFSLFTDPEGETEAACSGEAESVNIMDPPRSPRQRTSSWVTELSWASRVVKKAGVDRKHTLDLYLPNTRQAPKEGWPLIVFVHGGGWQRGDKRASNYFLSNRDVNLFAWLLQRVHLNCYGNVGASFARAGVACAVVNYRLSALRFPWFFIEVLSSSVFNYCVLLFAWSFVITVVLPRWMVYFLVGETREQMKEILNYCPGLDQTSIKDAEALFTAIEHTFGLGASQLCQKGTLLSLAESLLVVGVLFFLFWGGLRSQSCSLFLTPANRVLPYAVVLVLGLIQYPLFFFSTLYRYFLVEEDEGSETSPKPSLQLCYELAVLCATLMGAVLATYQIVMAFWRERSSRAHHHPEHAKDVARAVRWAVAEGRSYNLNPTKLVLSGHSAGGHLVSLLATDPAYLEEVGLSSSTIKGVISISGVYDVPALGKSGWQKVLYLEPAFGKDSKLWQEASPLFQAKQSFQLLGGEDTISEADTSEDTSDKKIIAISRNLPPFLLLHAANNEAGLDIQAAQFEELLNSIKQGLAERFSINNRNHLSVVSDIQDFLQSSQRDEAMEYCDNFLQKLDFINTDYFDELVGS